MDKLNFLNHRYVFVINTKLGFGFSFFFKNKFIYLFLDALGLRCCALHGLSLVARAGATLHCVRGLLIAVASLVAEHRL